MSPPQREQLAFELLFPADRTHAHTVIRAGRRTRTVYRAAGAVVGTVEWGRWGRHPRRVTTPRWQLEYHDGGTLALAVPLLDGMIHGDTAQWTPDGALLVSCRFTRGTGTDLFCCAHSGRLLEAHPARSGQPHGWERWWEDEGVLSEEIHWVEGRRHGPHRSWRDGALSVRWFVAGRPVSVSEYLDAARADPTLPPDEGADARPQRPAPAGFSRRVFRRPPWPLDSEE